MPLSRSKCNYVPNGATRHINKYCEDNYDTNELFGKFKSNHPRKFHGINTTEVAKAYPKINPDSKERLYGRGWFWERAGYNSFYFKFLQLQPYMPKYSEHLAGIDVEYMDARDEAGNLVMLPSIPNGLTKPGYKWEICYNADQSKWFKHEPI